jgi:hypothetical protein
MPEKKVREKGKYEDFILKLMGRIFLTKKVFFGFDEQKIVIIVTPTLKIATVVASSKKLLTSFPFIKNTKLDLGVLKKWSKDNGYDIAFSTPLPRLKSTLKSELGDVMITESKDNVDDLTILLDEVKKSNLPESVKKWVIENPEKFKNNIQEVKELLKRKRGE